MLLFTLTVIFVLIENYEKNENEITNKNSFKYNKIFIKLKTILKSFEEITKKKMSISDDIDENNIYEENLNLHNKNSEIEEKSSVYNQEMMSENNNSNVLYDSNKSMTKLFRIFLSQKIT